MLSAYSFDQSLIHYPTGQSPLFDGVDGELYIAGSSGLYRADGGTGGTELLKGPGVADKIFSWGSELLFFSGSVQMNGSGLVSLDRSEGVSRPITANGHYFREVKGYAIRGQTLFIEGKAPDRGPSWAIYALQQGETDAKYLAEGQIVGVAGSTLYFEDAVNGPPYTMTLYRSDGADVSIVAEDFDVYAVAKLGEKLIFEGIDQANNRRGLWTLDEPGNFQWIESECYGMSDSWAVLDGKLILISSIVGRGVWISRTDGSIGGLQPLTQNIALNYPDELKDLIGFNGRAYYTAYNATGHKNLYALDSLGQIEQITTFNDGSVYSSMWSGLYVAGDQLFFSPYYGGKTHLYQTNGLANQYQPVEGFTGDNQSNGNHPLRFSYAGGSLYVSQPIYNSSLQKLWRVPLQTASLENRTWVLNGTDPAEGTSANDTFMLTRDGGEVIAIINGQTYRVAGTDVDRIIVNGFGGDDSLDVRDGTLPWLRFNGDSGHDSLRYALSGQSAVSLHGSTLHDADRRQLYGIESLDLAGSAGNDVIDLGQSPLSGPIAAINVSGGEGNDSLFLRDESGGTYVLNQSLFNRGDKSIGIDSMEEIHVFTGSAADTLKVASSSSTAFHLFAGDPTERTAASPGDVLIVSNFAQHTNQPGIEAGSGRIIHPSYRPIQYGGFETVDSGAMPLLKRSDFAYRFADQAISFSFNKAVVGWTPDALRLVDLATHLEVEPSSINVSFDYLSNTSTFAISDTVFGARLPGSVYHVSVDTTRLTDLSGRRVYGEVDIEELQVARGPRPMQWTATPGSYTVLSAAASSGTITSYVWDFDYDGVNFTDDVRGMTPIFDTTGRKDLPESVRIALQVTDADGRPNIESGLIVFSNVAPTATFTSVRSKVLLGESTAVRFTDASDPSKLDGDSGFLYSYDFNNDGRFEITNSSLATASVSSLYLNNAGLFAVRGRISDRRGAYSDYLTSIEVETPTPPAAPANLQATAISGSAVRLNWVDNAANETSFQVQRATVYNYADAVLLSGVPTDSTTAVSAGLTPRTYYYFRVRSVNSAGISAWSNSVKVKTLSGTAVPVFPPATPAFANIAWQETTASSVRLYWTDSSNNETGFRIRRSGTLDFAAFNEVTVGANVTSYTDQTVQPDTMYYYKVQAFNSAGSSDFSGTVGTKTPAAPPPPPGEVKLISPTSLVGLAGRTTMQLSWLDNAIGETGYQVQISTVYNYNPANTITLSGSDLQSYLVGGLNPSTWYYFRVRATDGTNFSGWSNSIKLKTLA